MLLISSQAIHAINEYPIKVENNNLPALYQI